MACWPALKPEGLIKLLNSLDDFVIVIMMNLTATVLPLVVTKWSFVASDSLTSLLTSKGKRMLFELYGCMDVLPLKCTRTVTLLTLTL